MMKLLQILPMMKLLELSAMVNRPADPAVGSLGACGVHHPDGRHRCGEDAILEPMAVLRILPDDEIIGADAVLQIMPGDEALGAFGHGEPSCRSNRWPVMQLLQILPLAVLEPLAGDAALADPADDEALGAFGVHHPDGSLADQTVGR